MIAASNTFEFPLEVDLGFYRFRAKDKLALIDDRKLDAFIRYALRRCERYVERRTHPESS
jgi:hypothetical protein